MRDRKHHQNSFKSTSSSFLFPSNNLSEVEEEKMLNEQILARIDFSKPLIAHSEALNTFSNLFAIKLPFPCGILRKRKTQQLLISNDFQMFLILMVLNDHGYLASVHKGEREYERVHIRTYSILLLYFYFLFILILFS